ncbi:MAG: hypothetical protein NWE83_14270 [Candidatus Bathyarchaeota archaeon]|nr:hypothetical protein [Candidatus Bathyarchaeota archaeon]
MSIQKPFIAVMIMALLVIAGFGLWSASMTGSIFPQPPSPSLPNDTLSDDLIPSDVPQETQPTQSGRVRVGEVVYTFDPTIVQTVRPDLFQPGFFSMFDVLVHLDSQARIDMTYHFDASMNTYVIDSLNEEPYWWYQAYYSGGWSENNVFRPDHYPWKDGTTLAFFPLDDSLRLEQIYKVWREEVTRRNNNEGILIIPRVVINGRSFSAELTDVEVTPHNLRTDVFQENLTTAIDVILSLGDQRELTYELQWYETIGSARIVKNYWVDGINDDNTVGRCGFVYEAGAPQFGFFRGNHIHLPADSRILNSPAYVEYFWICV